ncbi:hypothetical protein D9M68_961410 [compost metagenome]
MRQVLRQPGVQPAGQDRLLGREVVVQRALGHVGFCRDPFHRDRLVALPLEQACGGVHQQFPHLRPLARPPPGLTGLGHDLLRKFKYDVN